MKTPLPHLSRPLRQEIKTSDKCILIVEDDRGISDVMKEVLKDEQYHVITAHSAGKAYDLLHTFVPHLFIIDYWLSDGEDGISFITWLREEQGYTHVPIIFMTADDAPPMKKYKDVQTLQKPFHLSDFLAKVKEALL